MSHYTVVCGYACEPLAELVKLLRPQCESKQQVSIPAGTCGRDVFIRSCGQYNVVPVDVKGDFIERTNGRVKFKVLMSDLVTTVGDRGHA
jgi:hypothetical protein